MKVKYVSAQVLYFFFLAVISEIHQQREVLIQEFDPLLKLSVLPLASLVHLLGVISCNFKHILSCIWEDELYS